MQARDMATKSFNARDMAKPSSSSRPDGPDCSGSTPTINITSVASTDPNTIQDSAESGSSRFNDKTPKYDQGQPQPINFPKLAGSGAQKMTRPVDEQESSADERTGLFANSDASRDYAAVGGSSSKVSGLATSDGGSSKKKKKKPASLRSAVEPPPEKKSWLKAYKEKYGSIELENVGSTARDHLALERTFLAWLRTSLSFASIGIAVTQLFRLNTNIGSIDPAHPAISHLRKVGKPLGATFIAIAIFILFIGFHRYFESQHYIIRGKFPASRGSVFFVALLAFSLSTASLVVVLTVGGTSISTGR